MFQFVIWVIMNQSHFEKATGLEAGPFPFQGVAWFGRPLIVRTVTSGFGYTHVASHVKIHMRLEKG